MTDKSESKKTVDWWLSHELNRKELESVYKRTKFKRMFLDKYDKQSLSDKKEEWKN